MLNVELRNSPASDHLATKGCLPRVKAQGNGNNVPTDVRHVKSRSSNVGLLRSFRREHDDTFAEQHLVGS